MAKNTATTLAGKRLAQVLRVSRVNGRAGDRFLSPDEQRDANEAFTAREGAEIVVTVDETDSISGGSMEREGLQYALQLCDSGEVDGIIVAKVDRFSRTLLGGLTVISDMEERGHLLVSAREGVIVGDAVSSSTDTLIRNLFLMLAQWQRDTLRESWEATRERHIANGVSGQEPYGYVKDERTRQLVEVPVEADFVRRMFQMRVEGKGWVAIAKAMNAAGAKPRRAERFTHARISAIVANRAYLGELRSGEYINTRAHEPIVDVDLYDAANGTRSVRVQTEAQTSLLAGIARCASCGQKMRSETRGKYRYYRCRVRHGWGECPEPVSVPADALDAFVEVQFRRDYCDVAPRGYDDDGALQLAQEALEGAEEELHAWVTVMSVRDEGFRAGYDVREVAVAHARSALTQAQTTARGFALPDGLADDWDQMTNGEKRSLLAYAYELAAVRSGRGWREDISTRTRIWGRNESGAPEVPLALFPISWDDPASAGVATA